MLHSVFSTRQLLMTASSYTKPHAVVRTTSCSRGFSTGTGNGRGSNSQSGTGTNGRWAGLLVGGGLALAMAAQTAFADDGNKNKDERSVPQKGVDLVKTVFGPAIHAYESAHEFFAGDQSPLCEPPPVDPYGRRVRTVVVNFNGTLVKCEWTRHGGWIVRKRPGVDKFLERCQQAGYEVILFASKSQMDVGDFVGDLDPYGIIRTRLFKDSCNFKHGRHVKDLTRLSRDLKSTVMIDHQGHDTALLQPHNCVNISEFKENSRDRELMKIAELLEQMQKYNTYDVREIVKKYNENPNVDHFKEEKQRGDEAQRQLDEEDGVVQQSRKPAKKKGGGWLSGLRK